MGGVSRTLRYAWAAPCSLVGLALGLVPWLAGARAQVVDGVLEIGGGRLGRWLESRPTEALGPRFGAITFGHVVLGTSGAVLARLRRHEQAHVRQYEQLGLLFFPAYAGSSLWEWVRGRRPYLDNHFEREARAAERQARA